MNKRYDCLFRKHTLIYRVKNNQDCASDGSFWSEKGSSDPWFDAESYPNCVYLRRNRCSMERKSAFMGPCQPLPLPTGQPRNGILSATQEPSFEHLWCIPTQITKISSFKVYPNFFSPCGCEWSTDGASHTTTTDSHHKAGRLNCEMECYATEFCLTCRCNSYC